VFSNEPIQIDDRTRGLLDEMKNPTSIVKEPTNDYEFLEAVVEALRQARRSWTKSFDLSYILIDKDNLSIEMVVYENGEKKFKRLMLVEGVGIGNSLRE
jgi:hypothetical protein